MPRLPGQLSRIQQPPVHWHLAQTLTEVQLDETGQAEAIAILAHNLDTPSEKIVTGLTLQPLAVSARASPPPRPAERLHHYQDQDS